jgi:hypothetical protein
MKGQTRVRLQVSDHATTRTDLIQRLYDRAVEFFGEEEFDLEGEISVTPSTEVSTAGKTLVTMWEGDAWFTSRER